MGSSMPAALTAEALLAIAAFALPTIAMGALFSHLSTEAIASGIRFGKALGVNTLAASAAPLVLRRARRPDAGSQAVAGADRPRLSRTHLARISWRKPIVWAPAGVAASIVFLAPRLAFIEVPEGGHVVSYEEGVMAAVSVVEDADGVARLRIDNRQQEGSSSTLASRRSAGAAARAASSRPTACAVPGTRHGRHRVIRRGRSRPRSRRCRAAPRSDFSVHVTSRSVLRSRRAESATCT